MKELFQEVASLGREVFVVACYERVIPKVASLGRELFVVACYERVISRGSQLCCAPVF